MEAHNVVSYLRERGQVKVQSQASGAAHLSTGGGTNRSRTQYHTPGQVAENAHVYTRLLHIKDLSLKG